MLATFTHLTGRKKGECEKFEAVRIPAGRAPDNSLRFSDSERRVSSHHAEIRLNNDHYVIRDLGSTNGTMINGRRVVTTELAADDLIEFGAGGPLVRFGIERAESEQSVKENAERNRPNPINLASRSPGASTVEIMVERAVRSRANNVMLIGALAAAMIVGAALGILVSSKQQAPDSGRLSIAEVAALNRTAVVFIRAEFEILDGNNQVVNAGARTGSGFVVSDSGLIVTNRHLLHYWEYDPSAEGQTGRVTRIEVVLPGQMQNEAIPAEIARLSIDKSVDVAVLKIDPPASLNIVWGIGQNLEHSNQGDEVVVIGYPLGINLLQLTNESRIETSLSTGVISRVSQEWIQLDLRAYNGSSGGPVLNRRGEAIGILTANVVGAQDITLCIPINLAMELVKQMQE